MSAPGAGPAGRPVPPAALATTLATALATALATSLAPALALARSACGAALAGLALLALPATAAAGGLSTAGGRASASLAYCDAGTQLSAEQRDVLLRFAAVVREELARSGARLALVARSGLDLSRLALRYSHAGLTLRASPATPWAVRQLYYACDEKAPRLFDQGLSAFLMGTDDASTGYVSIVYLPEPEASKLERRALDNRLALALLGGSYSANAYPYSTRYQNCNQWLAELLAASWSALPAAADAAGDGAGDPANSRARAQQWLRDAGYAPTAIELGTRPWLWAASLLPWLHLDDHPAEDLERQRLLVSMPGAIESFVRRRLPRAERVELCHDSRQVVLRRGWEPIADGCRAGPGDSVRPLP